ncbi:zinc ribbon domain-containing protein [Granulicella aggregans]|nr:zinc ribbon domain-containing protein [Granulicella aggregans]
MIEFVRNYSDHSTDRGYQFEFRCDHCGNGYMSSYEASLIGTAGGLLQAAGSIFGGFLGSAGNSSYEIQRAIGGPAHDRALQQAVTEVKEKFHRCQRCGEWVCAEVCWNTQASQCTGCTPKYEQEAISLRTQAQITATREQMYEKARGTDYVSGVDMSADAQIRFNPPAPSPQLPVQSAAQAMPSAPASDQWTSQEATPVPTQTPWSTVPASAAVAHCTSCGEALSGGKFCPGCGAPTAPPVPRACAACGHVSGPTAKFCEDCGGKLA